MVGFDSSLKVEVPWPDGHSRGCFGFQPVHHAVTPEMYLNLNFYPGRFEYEYRFTDFDLGVELWEITRTLALGCSSLQSELHTECQ